MCFRRLGTFLLKLFLFDDLSLSSAFSLCNCISSIFLLKLILFASVLALISTSISVLVLALVALR